MVKKHAPRHRAARRPITPFTGINTAGNRRKAAAVTATGLGVAFIVSSNAVAADGDEKDADVAQIASEAKTALKTNPEVVVDEKAEWNASEVAAAEVRGVPRRYLNAAVANGEVKQDGASAGAGYVASGAGGSVVDIAMRYVGAPYRFGGMSPRGFDCSGFTSYVFSQAGVSLPHLSRSQGRMGKRVPFSEAQPGDLLYWPSGHVGIYVGGGKMIDSSMPGTRVQVRRIWGTPQVRRI